MNRRSLTTFATVAVMVFFFWGMGRLFSLRFTSGEAYPPGSSLRADPRGTRVLHDSLASLSGFQVRRNFDSLTHLVLDPQGHTLILAGYDADLFQKPVPKPVVAELDRFAREGGRVVLALAYVRPADLTNSWMGVRRTLRSGPRTTVNPANQSLADAWGIAVEPSTGASLEATTEVSATTLPARIPWPGVRRFQPRDESWKPVYIRDAEAVVVERPLGRGTLVLLADDYLLSNEALRHRREPQFLTWLVGENRRIVFDETHLGLSQPPGLASLLRRYQLGGAVLGALLVAGLYLWQQAVPFLPRRVADTESGADGETEPVAGRETAAGFRNLLQRAVPAAELTPALFAQWRDSAGRRCAVERLRDAQDVINLENARPPGERDPVGAFQKLAARLNPDSRHPDSI